MPQPGLQKRQVPLQDKPAIRNRTVLPLNESTRLVDRCPKERFIQRFADSLQDRSIQNLLGDLDKARANLPSPFMIIGAAVHFPDVSSLSTGQRDDGAATGPTCRQPTQ